MELAKTIARPYAQALYDLCLEQNLDKNLWQDFLQACKLALEEPVGQQVLETALNPAVVKKFLVDVVPPELSAGLPAGAVANFFQVLQDNKRFAYLPAIYDAFVDLRQGQDLPIPCSVYSAHELTPADVEALQRVLEARLHAKVETTTVLDPSLLTGLVITGKDYSGQVFKMDCSGRKVFDDLKSALLKA